MSSEVSKLDRPTDRLPNGWRSLRLGDVARLGGGTTPARGESAYWDEASVPWATPSDITSLPVGVSTIAKTERMVSDRALAECSLSLNPPGTVLMTSRATIGFAAINSVPMATNQGFINFTAGQDIDAPFLLQWLIAQRPNLVAAAGGSTFKELSRGTAKLLPIDVPPLDEQRRIAEVLRSVDEAVAAADAVIGGLQAAASEIAQRAFSDPDDVELDCDVTTFGDLFDIKGGNQPPKSSFVYQPKEGYVRLLQIRDFESDDKPAYIPEESTTARCAEGDILIARYGASVGRILTGKAGAYNVALTKIVFRDDRIVRRYAYHWLRSEYFQSRIKAVSNRSAQAGFNKEDLFPTKIALPRLPAQAEVAEALDDIERAVSVNRHERDQLADLKTALRDDLLSGRVRVPA